MKLKILKKKLLKKLKMKNRNNRFNTTGKLEKETEDFNTNNRRI